MKSALSITSIKSFIGYLYKWHVARYLFVGFSTFAIDLGLLYVLHGRLKVVLPVAVTISYTVAVIYNFTLSLKWTFTNKEKKSLYLHFVQYLVLLGFNYLFTVVFVSLVGKQINYAIAKVIAAAILVLWTYPVYRFVIFKPPAKQKSEAQK